MKTVLFILVFSTILKLSAQFNSSMPDTIRYQKLSRNIKNVIVNKCHVNGKTMDSLYLAGKLNLRWEHFITQKHLFFIVHFVDTAFQHYVFTFYYRNEIDSDPDYIARKAGKPYYITGFDTVHVFERKRLLKLMDNQFAYCRLLFADVAIHYSDRHKVFTILKNDNKTRVRIRRSTKTRRLHILR